MAGLCEGGNEPSGSLKASKLTKGTWQTWFQDPPTDGICLRELLISKRSRRGFNWQTAADRGSVAPSDRWRLDES
ncbi:hypothetical protein ANN_18173 [Periplaneta americana]|uniref:Uncharacterized protein n=1 Tax=Periplaneta americana TaxID=6978 RepID=A0ABQ8SPD7_PERAM|nr:hypothetical protein ANN_18173 [Periplaneta americana]